MDNQNLSPIIDSLEKLFQRLNQKFYSGKLPETVITVSPNTARGVPSYGWITTQKVWTTKEAEDDRGRLYEINICAEYIADPSEQIVTTMLHEMAHLYNLQHNINDTSRAGKYHNKKFKTTAEAHGLCIKKDIKYGWTITELNDVAKAFVNDLEIQKISLYRTNTQQEKTKRSKQSSRRYVCPKCDWVVRATKEGPLICGKCMTLFELKNKH